MAIEQTGTGGNAASQGGKGNLPAVGFMLVSAIAASLIPLLINFSGGSDTPFLFNVAFRIGISMASLLILFFFYRKTLLNKRAFSILGRRIFVWPYNGYFVLGMANTLDYALFAWSVQFIDVAISALLFETWPVFTLFLMAFFFREEGRYSGLTLFAVGLVLLSMSGFVFAMGSQVADFSNFFENDFFGDAGIGLALIILATLLTSLVAANFKWGANLAEDLAEETDEADGDLEKTLGMCGAIIALLTTSLASIVISLGIGLASGESFTFRAMPLALMTGFFAYSAMSIFWRMSNLFSSNLGVNLIPYATPIMSLIWLFWLGQADVPRPDYLVVGAAAIITANLLINVETEIRMGFKALILALGGCGSFVYFRGEIFEFLNVVQWDWTGGGYFQSITLAATVFILLLAFRVSRVVTRASDEDNRTFLVYRKLDMLARRNVIDPQVCQYILDLDRANNNSAVEQEAYNKARQLIEAVDPTTLDTPDAQLLSDAEANLDALVDSKRVDIHLGEMFALVIFGGITIGLSLLSLPPNAAGWTRLLVDMIAMLVSSVIVYLLFHIQDLQQERDEHNLDSDEPQAGGHLRSFVYFRLAENQAFNQWLSIIVGIAIVLTYSALLGYKWLGWFS